MVGHRPVEREWDGERAHTTSSPFGFRCQFSTHASICITKCANQIDTPNISISRCSVAFSTNSHVFAVRKC
jgi:hypothetical protein